MSSKLKVLIVDDAEVNRITLRKILEESYEILEAENGQQALDILATQPEDAPVAAVVLDLIMPGMSGVEFLELYKNVDRYRLIPIIIATIEGDTQTERECLELGAWDFISKPYDPTIIRFRIKNAIDRSQMQLSKELKYRAEYDPMTNIYNKSKFFQNVEFLRLSNPWSQYAFVRVDIEKFQLVNAFFGVAEGDRLLRYVADEMRAFSDGRVDITYGRIEADIFAIFLPYQTRDDILAFVNHIRERLEQYDLEFDIVPSFGIYEVDDTDIPPNRMCDRANLATKQCKGNYIENYAFYTAEMSEEIVREQRIVNRMKRALEEEEFVLYLQPKYELSSNTISGAEVLVRWASPGQGMVSPGVFIPVFERNGFISKLDYYVWDKTCQLIAKWLKEGRKPYPVSVNISRVSLYNPRMVDVICSLVKKYDIPPYLLQLELTESAYTSNPKAIKEMMERLQKEGFAILMDDFGSGYSSLNVLKDIAVDVLKIDMKFLSDTDKQGRSENILASVVRMAKWLNMPVVAEGVERREQADFLRSIGCEYVQGYYFARPMPVEEYEKLAFCNPFFGSESRKENDQNHDNFWDSSSQMEILFSNMIQAVAVYEYDSENDNFDVIRVNNAYYEMFGHEDINVSSQHIMESLDEKCQKELLDAFKQAVATQTMSECEVLRRTDSGKYIWVQVRLKYINQVGKRHVLFAMMTDITAQKEIDLELQKYRAAFSMAGKKGETILVVDDLEVNRVSLRCIFEDKYQVLEASNGKEALEILSEKNGAVDVILLDIRMPVMDGTEFLKHKRKNPAMAGIPVVIITADDTPQRQAEILKLGADDYVVKPFIPEIATRRVSNVLELNRRFGQVIQRYHNVLDEMQNGKA